MDIKTEDIWNCPLACAYLHALEKGETSESSNSSTKANTLDYISALFRHPQSQEIME